MNRFLLSRSCVSMLLLVSFVGLTGCPSSHDPVVGINADDPEMKAAMQNARESVQQFIDRLDKKSPGEEYLIKMPLGEGDDVEHIWVRSVTFKDGKFSGILANDPFNANYSVGDAVSVPVEEISDWVIFKPDRSYQGGFTQKVLLKKAGRLQ